MKNTFILIIMLALTNACYNERDIDIKNNNKEVNNLLDDWHQAAASADYDNYFNAMAKNSVFIGTDAKENWDKKSFQAYAKPHFDKGKAWNFKSIERTIYFNQDSTVAWYDELLDTQMKICRGSGVAIKEDNIWKIKHYVLSMTIPNEISNTVVAEKDSIESLMISAFKMK